jgi:hypothetical protein
MLTICVDEEAVPVQRKSFCVQVAPGLSCEASQQLNIAQGLSCEASQQLYILEMMAV